MAVYAAMVDELDQSVGRLRDALVEMGEWDNTLVVFLSDNGASREGEATGTTNYFAHLAGGPDTVDLDIARLDEIGSATTMPHYPRWAMTGNTPFRLYKRNTHAGGHQVPCIVSWPRGTRDGLLSPGMRAQYAHCIDVLPTALHLAGISPASHRHGMPAKPMNGTSLVGVLAATDHAEVHAEQYYELVLRATGGSTGRLGGRHQPTSPGHVSTTTSGSCTTCAPIRPSCATSLPRCPTRSLSSPSVSTRQRSPTVCTPSTRAADGGGWCATRRMPSSNSPPPSGPTRRRSSASGPVHCVAAHRDDHDHVTVRDGDRGVLVSHGDQGGGYAVVVDEGSIGFVHNDGHGHTVRHTWGAIAPGDRVVVVVLAAPGWQPLARDLCRRR